MPTRFESGIYMTAPHQEDTEKTRPDVRAADILDPNSQIGNRLRSLYAAAQDEAIPDRFLDLLEKLDQVEMASAKSVERE
jgi:Anti-sigma factor NepR